MPDALPFVLMSLSLLLTPGPTNTLLAVGGAAAGLRRAWPLVPAELAGYFAAIHLYAFLLGPLVQQSPLAQGVLRLVLALYIFWLAARLWQSEMAPLPHQTVTPARIFLVTLLNPKALVFTFVVLPPLAGQWAAALPWLGALAAMILLASASWIGLGAAIARGRILRPHLIPRTGAIVLAGFALVMLLGLARQG